MNTQLVYALIAFMISLVLYRPFATRLDHVRYTTFCLLAFVAPMSSQLLYTAPFYGIDISDHYSNYTIDQFSSTGVLGTTQYHNHESHHLFQNGLLQDSMILALLTGTTITICGILSRWDFPILYVKPESHYMIDIAYRHVPSICLVIAAFIHRNNQQYQQVNDPMQHQIACFFAPLLGGVWYFAGTYLFRRWHITMAASLIPALIWTFPKNQNICSIFSQWSFYDWFACTLMITSATLMLDYFDAILNMYPYLVTSSAKQREAIQDPARAPYWLALGELMLSLSSERELNPLPIRDMQEAIKKLGHSGRSWKTMSILFPSNLRQEMCMLYAWFRLCDDLVDDAEEYKQGRFALNLIRTFLDESFNGPDNDLKTCTSESGRLAMQDPSLPFLDWDYLDDHLTSDRLAVFRCFARQAFMLCPKAANALTEAWAIDLKKKPLKTEENVKNYASLISGRFAELCTCVIMYKTGHGNWNGDDFEARDSTVLHRARATGQCLQLVNIARDIVADSHEGRCYVPLKFMQDQSIYTTLKTRRPDVVDSKVLKGYAIKILGLADSLVPQGHLGINGLPFEVRDGVRAAFEIYLAIGPALREAENFPIRAKVPKSRQKMIAFSCIYGLYGLRAKSMGAIRSLIHPFGPSYYQKPSASF